LTAANWLQFYEAATFPMRGRQDRAGRPGKTLLIDFADKFPAAKRGARCQSVVRLRSTIRMAQSAGAVPFEIFPNVFWA
jgi:hypothetical protein